MKQWNADFETVQNSLGPALTYLRRGALRGDLRRPAQPLDVCGAALARIRETESFLDSYLSLTAFCQSLSVDGKHASRRNIGRLIKCAEVLAKIPPALIGKIDIPLSFRLIGDLGKLDDGERAKLFDAIAEAPTREAAGETLRAGSKSSSPKKERAVLNDMDKVRRITYALEDWFADFGGETEVRPLIRDMLSLAERFVVAKRLAA